MFTLTNLVTVTMNKAYVLVWYSLHILSVKKVLRQQRVYRGPLRLYVLEQFVIDAV